MIVLKVELLEVVLVLIMEGLINGFIFLLLVEVFYMKSIDNFNDLENIFLFFNQFIMYFLQVSYLNMDQYPYNSLYENQKQYKNISFKIYMDIYNIKQNLVALEQIGYTLSTSQRMRLQLGLLKLTDLANSDQLLFWGKIITTGQPYYIAVGIDFQGQYAFPHKKFYWSSSNMEFKQLPVLDSFHKEKVQSFYHLPFSGDSNQVLINVQGEEGGQNKQIPPQAKNEDSQQQQQVKVLPKNFTELDRLSYTVRSIQIECQVYPIGGFKLIEKHQVRYNDSFQGLKLNEISLKKFQHFRYPLSRTGIEKLQKSETVFMYDFLQPLQNESEWSIQVNTTRDWVTVRNLTWQGYVAFHRLGTKNFGGIYYGNGIKSVDMLFYI